MHPDTAAVVFVVFETNALVHALGASLAVRSLSGKLDRAFQRARNVLFGGQPLTKKSLENMTGNVGCGQSVSSDSSIERGRIAWGPKHVHSILDTHQWQQWQPMQWQQWPQWQPMQQWQHLQENEDEASEASSSAATDSSALVHGSALANISQLNRIQAIAQDVPPPSPRTTTATGELRTGGRPVKRSRSLGSEAPRSPRLKYPPGLDPPWLGRTPPAGADATHMACPFRLAQ